MRYLLLAFLFLSACATRFSVPEHYSERTADSKTNSTTLFILVDGLAVQTLDRGLAQNNVPNIQAHFLGAQKKYAKAHSIYPGLTFPNISGLLKEKPVHITGALGNSLVYKGQRISFESALDRPRFGEIMKGDNVFSRLREQNRRSVSLDYGLGVDATVASDILDLKSGLALEFQDYLYLDKKRIDSLKLLLLQNTKAQWPDFIFMHLVGVDFLSHRHGPQSPLVQDYLKLLDQSLKAVFDILRDAEAKGERKVVTMLSADHGFNPNTTRILPLEKVVSTVAPELYVMNEGRMAALYAPKEPNESQLQKWSQLFLKTKGIQVAAYRKGHLVEVRSKTKRLRFQYVGTMQCPDQSMGIAFENGSALCPQDLPPAERDQFYPYFVQNLAFYFQAEKHPDLTLIPDQQTAFHDHENGFHGGPTSEEIYVPLLLRNASLKENSRNPALWELLRFL